VVPKKRVRGCGPKSPAFRLAPAVYLAEFYNLKLARYRLGEEKRFQLVASG